MKFLITRWLETTSILVVMERIYGYQFKSNFLNNHRIFAIFFLYFWYLHEICNLLKKKKNEPHRSSISEVIDSGRCVYLNAKQCLFLKTLWQWTSQQVPKIPEICRKLLVWYFFFILSQIVLQKVIFNQNWYFWTAW